MFVQHYFSNIWCTMWTDFTWPSTFNTVTDEGIFCWFSTAPCISCFLTTSKKCATSTDDTHNRTESCKNVTMNKYPNWNTGAETCWPNWKLGVDVNTGAIELYSNIRTTHIM